MDNKIPVFDIKIGELEKKFIRNCLDKSAIGQGSYVKKFEEEFFFPTSKKFCQNVFHSISRMSQLNSTELNSPERRLDISSKTLLFFCAR